MLPGASAATWPRLIRGSLPAAPAPCAGGHCLSPTATPPWGPVAGAAAGCLHERANSLTGKAAYPLPWLPNCSCRAVVPNTSCYHMVFKGVNGRPGPRRCAVPRPGRRTVRDGIAASKWWPRTAMRFVPACRARPARAGRWAPGMRHPSAGLRETAHALRLRPFQISLSQDPLLETRWFSASHRLACHRVLLW